MFTKKLEDQFSADLLNTVRGVLDEAKHNKDCECEKCEDKEEDDEDEIKEGFVSAAQRKAVWASKADGGAGHPDKKKKMKKEGYAPTADEPTEANKKVAQKIRDMMAKEKKPVKEDSEQIDELSTKTLEKYRNVARNDAYDADEVDDESRFRKRAKGITQANKAIRKNFVKGVNEEEQIDELSKDTMGRYVNKAADRMSTQGVTAGLKIAADEKSKKNFDNIAKRQKGIATAVKKLTKEESEQIDELSKKTLGSYVKKASGAEQPKNVMSPKNVPLTKIAAYQGDSETGYFGKRFNQATYDKAERLRKNRETGIKTAVNKLTKEEQDFIDALNNDTLEEGRGRPPKEGSPAWHAKQKQANDDMVALGMQLRKAKSINKKVRFMDNKEHEISSNHIGRFEDHMAARRTTQEKDNFQKQAHKSHADFIKAVSAPVPKAAKDTGEIVKYR